MILHKTGHTGRSRFQYKQVSSLVSNLMKTENVFRPRSAFEDLLLSGERTKLLSKVYRILSSSVEVTERVSYNGKMIT